MITLIIVGAVCFVLGFGAAFAFIGVKFMFGGGMEPEAGL